MKAISYLCVSSLIAILSLVAGTSSQAASIVKATYSLDGKSVARMVYTGADGGPNSDREPYWSLLGKTPEAAYEVTIRPDRKGGVTATLTGEITVSVEIRNQFNMGVAKTDRLMLFREDVDSDRWYVPAKELKRLTTLIDKEPAKADPKSGQERADPAAKASEQVVVPLDVSRFKFHQGRILDQPAVCQSPEELIESLGEEMARQNLSKIDFTTQEVLVFKWDNSGSDSFEVIPPKKPDEPWVFLLTRGSTKAKIADIRAYAVPRKISWEFNSIHELEELLPK